MVDKEFELFSLNFIKQTKIQKHISNAQNEVREAIKQLGVAIETSDIKEKFDAVNRSCSKLLRFGVYSV